MRPGSALARLNPFGGSAKTAKSVDDESFLTPGERDRDRDSERSVTGRDGRTNSHDAETLALIQRTFEDVEPSQRAELMSILKGLDSKSVRVILKNWRLQDSLEKPSGDDDAPAFSNARAWDSDPPIKRGDSGHSFPPGTGLPPQLNAGPDAEPWDAPRSRQPAGPRTAGNDLSREERVRRREELRKGDRERQRKYQDQRRDDNADWQTAPPRPYGDRTVRNPDSARNPGSHRFPERDASQYSPRDLNRSDERQISPDSKSRTVTRAGYDSQMPSDWNRSLERLIAATDSMPSARVPTTATSPADRAAYLRQQVYLRMLYLMSDKPHESATSIAGLNAADQKFWTNTFLGLTDYLSTDPSLDEASRATRAVSFLRKATTDLQESANLKIEQLAFCTEITNFGNYEQFPQNHFSRGEPVLIYAEMANFKSLLVENGDYQTILKSKVELHRVGATRNTLVKEFEFEPIRDLCHNRRRDYFHSYELTIPREVGLGPHLLTLIVTDEQGKKFATDSIRFTVK